jgi:flap endonuclease GEN
MTVSSLWTVLDEAGCGTPVSMSDLVVTDNAANRNSWATVGGGGGGGRPWETILAVDLSIWICEGLTSTALTTFHADPVCHLVYRRTTRLLDVGIGLVFVVEGTQRRRSSSSEEAEGGGEGGRRRMRGGHAGRGFWNASDRCESMIRAMGVPIVRAEYGGGEAEALCALLNSSGLVDGVISNDGDCLLYGANTVYANFTIKNLEENRVMRYDAGRLYAIVVDANGEVGGGGMDDEGGIAVNAAWRRIRLSREDLIAFGMICGSDVCGVGMPHCGHRKAVRFLDAYRRTRERGCDDEVDGACLDELFSWSDVVAARETTSRGGTMLWDDVCHDCVIDVDDDGPCTVPPSRSCSHCLHPGDKLRHERHGCAECGTGPGEGCIVVTSDEKFLRSMKEKALRSDSTIAPRHVVNRYFSPNGNNVPSLLTSLKSRPYVVSPDPATLFATSLILKGRTRESSREYIKQTLPRLLARLDLWDTGPRNRYVVLSRKYKPIPIRIERSVVRESLPRYEVNWSINVGVIDDEVFQFSTCESQSTFESAYPQLVTAFRREERRRQQCLAEDERRKRFTGAGDNRTRMNNDSHKRDKRRMISNYQRAGRGRWKNIERKFDVNRVSNAPKATAERGPTSSGLGLDVTMLVDYMPNESSDEESNDCISLGHAYLEPYRQEWSDQFDQNGDVCAAFYEDDREYYYREDDESLCEDMDEILSGDYDRFLPFDNTLNDDEHRPPCPGGSSDGIGCGNDRSVPSETAGGNQQDLRSDVPHRLFCDLGVVQVLMSPIISRRCRLLDENGC